MKNFVYLLSECTVLAPSSQNWSNNIYTYANITGNTNVDAIVCTDYELICPIDAAFH